MRAGVTPFSHGSELYTDIMKTAALRQALDAGAHDVIFGGGRRDEEGSRAKERVFSPRSATHQWDPKTQRPEVWKLYNTRLHRGESLRVSPLSNWTEADVLALHPDRGDPPSCRSTTPPNVRSSSATDGGSWSTTTGCRSGQGSGRGYAGSASERSAATR